MVKNMRQKCGLKGAWVKMIRKMYFNKSLCNVSSYFFVVKYAFMVKYIHKESLRIVRWNLNEWNIHISRTNNITQSNL
jgi:hypothetical protein